jgi:hypothetical protein
MTTANPRSYNVLVKRSAFATMALTAMLFGGVLTAGCSAGATNQKPVALPSGSNASPRSCQTYFGTQSEVSDEFGVSLYFEDKVARTVDGQMPFGVSSSRGAIVCPYTLSKSATSAFGSKSLLLFLTTQYENPVGGDIVAEAKAGKVYAYALTTNRRFAFSTARRKWLKAAAAKAAPPT